MAGPLSNMIRRLNLRVIDLAVFLELLLLAIVYSRLYSFFPNYRSVINIAAIVIPLLFVVPALYSRTISALYTIGILFILIFYQLWFSVIWNTPFTGSALGAFQGLALTAMIAVHARDRDPARFLVIMFMSCLVYLVLYLFFLKSIDASYISMQQSRGESDFASSIMRTHASKNGDTTENSYRLVVSGVHLAFPFIYALSWLTVSRSALGRLIATALLALSGYCLWVSDSRFNTATTLIAALSIFIPLPARLKGFSYFGIAVAGVFAYSVAAFANFNLFSFLSFDQSGVVRAQEFVAANPVFLSTPILGTGLWNTGDDLRVPYNGAFVAPSDLGWYGELLQHGVVGAVLLMLCYLAIPLLISRLGRSETGSRLSIRVLTSLSLYFALVQFVTTQLWEGAGAIFVSLTLAYISMRTLNQTAAAINIEPAADNA